MLDVIVSRFHSVPRENTTEWSTLINKLGHIPFVVEAPEAKNLLTDLNKVSLFIIEYGYRIFDQGPNRKDGALKYLHNISRTARKRSVPLVVVSDRSAYTNEARQEIARHSSYFIDQPLTHKDVNNSVDRCIAMGIDRKTKPYLVVKDADRLMNVTRDKIAKSMGRVSLGLERGKTYHVDDQGYSVKYCDDSLFTSGGNCWLEFTPDSRSYLSTLSLMLRDWRHNHESERTDGKKTSIELCLRK